MDESYFIFSQEEFQTTLLILKSNKYYWNVSFDLKIYNFIVT